MKLYQKSDYSPARDGWEMRQLYKQYFHKYCLYERLTGFLDVLKIRSVFAKTVNAV